MLPSSPAARRLLQTAAEVAGRLRPVCADWPDDRFGELVYRAALARLRSVARPDDAAALHREYEAHRDAYVAALRAARPADALPGR